MALNDKMVRYKVVDLVKFYNFHIIIISIEGHMQKL